MSDADLTGFNPGGYPFNELQGDVDGAADPTDSDTIHQNDDLDLADSSHHHSLGYAQGQAAPGNEATKRIDVSGNAVANSVLFAGYVNVNFVGGSGNILLDGLSNVTIDVVITDAPNINAVSFNVGITSGDVTFMESTGHTGTLGLYVVVFGHAQPN